MTTPKVTTQFKDGDVAIVFTTRAVYPATMVRTGGAWNAVDSGEWFYDSDIRLAVPLAACEHAGEMVEMVESMEHWLSCPPTTGSDRDLVADLVRRARAILAKVRGEGK